MKKLFAFLVVLCLLYGILPLSVAAATPSAKVYVTIADGTGALALSSRIVAMSFCEPRSCLLLLSS